MRIRDIPTGSQVAIYGEVVAKRGVNGATMLRVPGIGASGLWEIVGSAWAEPQVLQQPAPMLVYLAGPIDAVSEDVALGWRVALSSLLPDSVVCFSPPSAYLGASMASAEAVDRANRAVIRSSHAIVANLEGGHPALGTMREVEYARSLDIPVLVISSTPLASLLSYDLGVVEDLGQVPQALLHVSPRRYLSPRDHTDAQGGSQPVSDQASEGISR